MLHGRTDEWTDGCIHGMTRPNQYDPNFFEVGGTKRGSVGDRVLDLTQNNLKIIIWNDQGVPQ